MLTVRDSVARHIAHSNRASFLYMTTHQHDSSQPQQSHDSPHLTGLGLMMEEMEEAALAGMLKV